MDYFVARHVTDFKDINGNTPEILLVDGNRTAGKTTAFLKLLFDDFLESGKKFMIIYRWGNELSGCADAIFKDIHTLFYPDHNLTSKEHAKGAYAELFLDNKTCGYAVSLNGVGKLKRYSHVFSDVSQMFFDEYQTEKGVPYVPGEVEKFQNLHTTVARGQGQPVRFVPVYMCSNSMTIFNPYYDALKITTRVKSDTRVLRGDGFVLIRTVRKEIADAQKASPFNRAFAGSAYMDSAINNAYLNDDNFSVAKKDTVGKNPLFVFKCDNKLYTVYDFGYNYHVIKGGDPNFSTRFGVLEHDRGSGFMSIRTTLLFYRIRSAYQNGVITYNDIICKQAFLSLVE